LYTEFKWETSYGFPDVSDVSSLADTFGISERMLLSGGIIQKKTMIQK